MQRELCTHQLESLWVDYHAASFVGIDQAREAVLCVREDRRSLLDLAQVLDVEVGRVSHYLEDLPSELAGAISQTLLGAVPGEVLGPLNVEGKYVVGESIDKILPSLDHQDVRERACQQLLNRGAEAQVEKHVEWNQYVRAIM